MEDVLTRRHERTFILGAFTNECVLSTAQNIKARNPPATVCMDTSLSVERHLSRDALMRIDAGNIVWTRLFRYVTSPR